MVKVRTLTVLLVVIALTGAACDSGSDADVAALEQRIAELEASTTSPTVTSTTTQPMTTTSSTTTTIPTTTTTEAEYDLMELDLGTLSQWAAADRVDHGFILFASSSCENAVDSLARVSRVFANEIRNASALVFAARDGTATVAEAADAFGVVTEALPYGGRAALVLSGNRDIGGATEFAELVKDTAMSAIIMVGSFPIFVLDVDAETVDDGAIVLWGGGVLDATEEFDSLGSRSWSTYCP